MMKHSLSTAFLTLFCVVVLAASLRGIPGNPTSAELSTEQWKEQGPLELSPDRGRFALAYSLVEDRSFQFSLPIARFATPDVGYENGRYVSLFAPGLSFLIIPGYLVGKTFGVSQVGAFAVVALFAILNVLLVRAVAVRLGAHPLAASIGALVFLFASPAFAYGVTLYQHHVSTFLLLVGVYVLVRWNTLLSVSAIWFLWATSVVVDNPNLILMLPLGVVALGRLVWARRDATGVHVMVKPLGVFTIVAAIAPLLFFLWVNAASYGDPFQLAGTVRSAEAIDATGQPTESDVTRLLGLESTKDPNRKKTALGFFKTRNLLRGFYVHAVSPDRGVLWYAPVLLLGALGFACLPERERVMRNLIVAAAGLTVLLYSMWGDPWGGWAFGSRYLVPVYALLGIGLALVIHRWWTKKLFVVVFLALLCYSVWVNALGALTSSANPPQVEVLALEEITGREQKYTFARNWDYLRDTGLKSFVWQTLAREYVSAVAYHGLLVTAIVGFTSCLLVAFIVAARRRSVVFSASWVERTVAAFGALFVPRGVRNALSKLRVLL